MNFRAANDPVRKAKNCIEMRACVRSLDTTLHFISRHSRRTVRAARLNPRVRLRPGELFCRARAGLSQRLIAVSDLMPEVAHPGHDHGQPGLVSGGDNIIIPD